MFNSAMVNPVSIVSLLTGPGRLEQEGVAVVPEAESARRQFVDGVHLATQTATEKRQSGFCVLKSRKGNW